VRIPTAAVLDVVTVRTWNPPDDAIADLCATPVHRSFDRLMAAAPSVLSRTDLSLHRRVLRLTPDGRIVLQDVNTSFADFVEGRRSPRSMER
jgi:hypothetical protein